MKKIIFTLMLMLVTALAVNAQSLTGKQWCTVLNDEDGEGIAAVTVPGTYKLDGKDLKIVTLAAKKLVLKNDDNQEIPFYDE